MAIGLGMIALIVVGAIVLVGILVYVIARQISNNSEEDFEKRDN
jgi:phage shock protein PspC (stress-responsive transcriptional regulator)